MKMQIQQKHIRFPDELADAVDKERRKESDMPSFSEMVRRLVNQALVDRAIVEAQRL